MPYFDQDDAAIYYETYGSGPPLVLLHGYALNGLMWELQKEAFSRNHTLITIDLRGFGKSSCGANWSGAIMASDVSGVLEQLQFHDIALLGFSMSGPVAVRVAIERPDLVARLILVSSILPSSGRLRTEAEIKMQERELDVLSGRGIEGWIEAMNFRIGPLVDGMFDKAPENTSLWEKIMAGHNPHNLTCMMQARLKTSSLVDWRSRLKEVGQRTMVIVGSGDDRFLDASLHLAREIPNASLEIIPNAGHMVNLEAVEKFNAAVLGFLKSAGAPKEPR